MNWFEQADFWSTFYAWMFPDASFEEAAAQVEALAKRLDLRTGAVLDLGCGPGRHSIPFARRGFTVTGVDLQPFLLDKARAYAARESATVEFVEADMRTFRRAEAFDLAISMFSSFGYFSDPADDLRVLENVYASLRSGGQIVIDLRGKEIAARHFSETLSSTLPDGSRVFQQIRIDDGWTRSVATWTYVRGEHAETFEVAFTLYSGAELKSVAENAGFGDVRLYGDLDGAPYDHHARRLVAVARKP